MLIFFELLATLALGFVLGRLWEIRQEMRRRRKLATGYLLRGLRSALQSKRSRELVERKLATRADSFLLKPSVRVCATPTNAFRT